MNEEMQKSVVSLTARQFIAGSACAALIYNMDDPSLSDSDIDVLVKDAAKIANRLLAELDRGRREHLRKKQEREATYGNNEE